MIWHEFEKPLEKFSSMPQHNQESSLAASVIMWGLYWTVAVKTELGQSEKLLIYQYIYIPILTCGGEIWVMIERERLWIQVA